MISRTDQRHLDDIIRRALHSVMREYLAPVVETEEFQVRLASAIAARCVAARVPKPRIEKPLTEAPSPAETAQEAKRRRQREWKRKNDAKKRAARAAATPATAGGTPAETGVNPKINLDHASKPDVQVMQPVPPLPSPEAFPAAAMREAAAERDATPQPSIRHPHTPTPATPMDPARLEPVPASYEDALDWLFAELQRQKMQPAEIETRLAALSTKQLLATCNAQRVKAGLSPYVLKERAA
jgi:hypothetical protein